MPSQKNPVPLASRSRAPKGKREPYQPKELFYPVPDDYFRSASYIDQRAAMGDFKGAPGRESGTVLVLHYLWRHTLRNKGLEDASQGREMLGLVLTGKSSFAKIAAETGLSYETVQRAVAWLTEARWVETEQGFYESGWKASNYIRVRMDMAGHYARTAVDADGPDAEGGTVSSDRQHLAMVSAEGQHQRRLTDKAESSEGQHTCGLGDDTIQGSLQGFYRDFDSGNSVTTTEENHQNQSQDRGGQSPHTPEGPGVVSSAPGSLASTPPVSPDAEIEAEITALIPEYTKRYPEWTESRIRGAYEFRSQSPAGKLHLLRLGLDAPTDAQYPDA